ncbi:transposase [Lactobacillus helveticus MTCC 5463]|nr:transposase [Lactobacillus helveticus MTCC 5463]
MDLNFYYQDIVIACFPNAQIVIDRFHMIQMLTRDSNAYAFFQLTESPSHEDL